MYIMTKTKASISSNSHKAQRVLQVPPHSGFREYNEVSSEIIRSHLNRKHRVRWLPVRPFGCVKARMFTQNS